MGTFHATFSEDKRLSAKFGSVQYIRAVEWYDGEYTVIPSQTAQELQTQGKTFAQNLIIEPIPSNYGLITWNGSTLTVS